MRHVSVAKWELGCLATVDLTSRLPNITAMPVGSHHRLEGRLTQSPRGLLLRLEDQGIWALDTDPDAEALIGKRVKVEGTRSGFDRIDVEWIAALDE